jgi:N-acetylmuramic acid 6-phosphate etherase
MDNRPLILGVDGGGTKTVACLALGSVASQAEDPPWTILGQGNSGSSNQQAVGRELATASLEEAIRQAFLAASLDLGPVSSLCLALAGSDRTADKDFIQEWAQQFIPAEHLCIVNDAVPLLVAGTPDQWGIALIAGTGSFCWGRNPAGQTARAGGWGYLMGDEGSGFSLGQAALQAVAQNIDGRGPQTTLVAKLLNTFNCQQPEELIPAVYGNAERQTPVAALAPIVLEEAAAGDPIALKIINQAAHSLTTMVESVAQQLGFQDRFPLVLAGGLLTSSPLLQGKFGEQMQDRGLTAEPLQSLVSPVLGTLQLAQQSLET